MTPGPLLVSLRDAPHRLLFAAARAYGPQRAIFGFMRKRFPNVVLGRTAVIFRYDDVLEVLGDEERFTNGPVYAAKVSQLEDVLGCLTFELTSEVMAELNEASKIELPFPQKFFSEAGVLDVLYGGVKNQMNDHRYS